jgi:hypothetical protein
MNNGKEEEEMCSVVVEKVGGRSSIIRCLSRYPLKFITPNKVFIFNNNLFLFLLITLNAYYCMLLLWSE